MFVETVLPLLQSRHPGGGPRQQRTYKFFGLPEPKIDQRIPYPELPPGVTVAFALEYPLVVVKLKAAGDGADFRLDQAEARLLQELGEHLMAGHGETPEERIGQLLRTAGLTLALAESCTGGLIASLLTRAPGASGFLERGAVTYADSAKLDWLQVPRPLIQQYGAVSEPCARAMAEGLRRQANTDLALSVTGIAGPDGGSAEKPVGTVFIALATADGTHVQRYRFHGDRQQVQQMTAYMALEWLRRYAGSHAP